jgi:TolB-like protein/Tfp pilus assembly protein PilF
MGGGAKAMNKLFSELRRRNVFRVAGVYAVVGWLLAQAAVVFETSLKLPDWFDTVIVSALLLGFPIALILAWAFEMTPEGMKLTANVPEGESIAPKTGRKLDFAILGGLALVGLMIVADRLTPKKAQSSTAGERAEASGPSAASIAVLPFADLSPAGDQEYFSQGIAEEILNVLANVAGLEVASRTSSFQFKGQEKIGIPIIADQLHVRHILEGSVRKAGDTIRITAQLIDGKTDKHLWSETYDRTLTTESIFAVQDEITNAIVDQLSSRVGAQKIAAPAARGADTENTDAYALFLEGQTRFVQRGADNIKLSIKALERAVEIDPGFARAWATLAADYTVAGGWLGGADLNRDFPALAEGAAKKAVALDPSLSLPYTVLGSIASDTVEDAAAMAKYAKAIELNPREEVAFGWRGESWRNLGYFDKAIADFEQCLAINPDYGNCRDGKGNAQIMKGEVEAGLATLNDNLRRGFDGGANPTALGVYAEQGNDAALLYELNETARDLADGDMRWAVDMMYQAMKNPNYDRAAALKVLEARLDGMGSRLEPESAMGAMTYLIFGAHDRMRNRGDSWWWTTRGFPDWTSAPERKQWMRERGLPDYWRRHGFPPQCKPVGKDDFECK